MNITPIKGWLGNIAIITAIILIGAGIYVMLRLGAQGSAVPQSQTRSKDIHATFSCNGGKTIDATFMNDSGSVHLILSDGRDLTLPHAISADGARYANKDESFVFWNKGNTAFITEGTATTYTGCLANN